MERHILWSRLDSPGLEHLYLQQRDEKVIADGVVIGLAEDVPFRAHYTVHCDSAWHVREVSIGMLDQSAKRLHLLADGTGHWKDTTGSSLPSLEGCLDVDISITPFTNTLPIRRLDLSPGELAQLTVAYIEVPQLLFRSMPQRYACLEHTPQEGLYRYESLDTHFTAELAVDAEGIVIDYPGLFRRIPIM